MSDDRVVPGSIYKKDYSDCPVLFLAGNLLHNSTRLGRSRSTQTHIHDLNQNKSNRFSRLFAVDLSKVKL